jgi:hypothetical protein
MAPGVWLPAPFLAFSRHASNRQLSIQVLDLAEMKDFDQRSTAQFNHASNSTAADYHVEGRLFPCLADFVYYNIRSMETG